MDWFWHVLLVCFIVVPIAVMWLAIAVEIRRRHDLSGFMKACWLSALFVFPLLGGLIYLILTWRRAEPTRSRASLPTGRSTVNDIADLDRLRQSGVLTDAEYAEAKRRASETRGAGLSSKEVRS